MPPTPPSLVPPVADKKPTFRRVGQTKILTGKFMAPVVWNWVRLMLLMVILMLVEGFSLEGVYMGKVLEPLAIGVVNNVCKFFCSMNGKMRGAQEMLWGRPPVRAKGRTPN